MLALNFDGNATVTVPINLAQFPAQWWGDAKLAASGLPPSSVSVRDVWARKAVGRATAASPWVTPPLPPRDCALLILKPA